MVFPYVGAPLDRHDGARVRCNLDVDCLVVTIESGVAGVVLLR